MQEEGCSYSETQQAPSVLPACRLPGQALFGKPAHLLSLPLLRFIKMLRTHQGNFCLVNFSARQVIVCCFLGSPSYCLDPLPGSAVSGGKDSGPSDTL